MQESSSLLDTTPLQIKIDHAKDFSKELDSNSNACGYQTFSDAWRNRSIGLTTNQAREVLKHDILSTLQKLQNEKNSRFFFSPAVDPCVWVIVLCGLCRLVAFVVLDHHAKWGFVEGLVLVSAGFVNHFLISIDQKRQDNEIAERVYSSISGLIDQQETLETIDHRQHVLLSPSTSYIAVYRDSIWQRIPMNLLVKGDVVALMSGDIAPEDIELIDTNKNSFDQFSNSPNTEKVRLNRGCRIPSLSKDKTVTRCTATDNPELLLSLCGDMRCFTILTTPIIQDIEKFLERPNRPDTLLRRQCLVVMSFILKLGIFTSLLLVLVLIVRKQLLHTSFMVFTTELLSTPVYALVCFVPIGAPVFHLIGEAAATSRILAVVEVLLHNNKRKFATVNVTNTEKKSFDHQDFDELDAEERQRVRSGVAHRFTDSRAWKYFFNTILFRLAPNSCAHNKFPAESTHGSVSNEGQNLSTSSALLPIPFRSTRLLERLGAITMLCVVDDEVLCEPEQLTEEIFLLKDETSSTTVLDLHPSYSSNESGLRFEDPQWKKHISSLKPIGLSVLLNSTKNPVNFSSVTNLLPNALEENLFRNLITQLSVHIRQLPSPDHLTSLAREIGFCDEDINCFVKRQTIHVVAPLLAKVEHMEDTHAQGQEETIMRGNLRSHLVSAIVLDKRSNGYQLLSRGLPSLALTHCRDFWDGKSICPMSSAGRKAVLDMYQKWRVEDLDCVAFTYAPISNKYSSIFEGNTAGNTLPDVYLVESSQAGKINDMANSPKKSSTACIDYDSDKRKHFGGEQSLSIEILSPSSGTDNEDRDMSLDEASTITEVHRNSSISLDKDAEYAEALWHLQADQIFLGMAASCVQPKAGISSFIEDLTAAGVRFVYFSPRNMRRSKPLAEKMGIETDWNCAISLRPLASSEPDPFRMRSTYSDWDVKARLPHGTEAIRRHIEQVDNVPLLVSLYTDSTPETVTEMISIFQEYDEVVLCIGMASRATNASMFSQADLAIALDGKAQLFIGDNLSHGAAESVLSSADLALSSMLNALACALTITDDHRATPNLNPLIDLIRLGRKMLRNFRQTLIFSLFAHLQLAILIVLGLLVPVPQAARLPGILILWMIWVINPALSLSILTTPSDSDIMSRTPEKNGGQVRELYRFVLYFLVRSIPSGLLCIFIYQWILGLSLQCSHGMNAQATAFSWIHYVLDSKTFITFPPSSQLVLATARAQSFMLFAATLCVVTSSIGFLHRKDSIFQNNPFRNIVWLTTAIAIVIIQTIISYSWCSINEGSISLSMFLAKVVPWNLWVILSIFPFFIIAVDECVKYHDRNIEDRFFRFLRMQFDTRLGMWSPK